MEHWERGGRQGGRERGNSADTVGYSGDEMAALSGINLR